jgi:hypothetical protein
MTQAENTNRQWHTGEKSMKPIRNVFGGIFIIGGLIALSSVLHAQDAATNTDFEVELQALEMTTPIPAHQLTNLWEAHGFYSAQNPDWPPLPADIMWLPVWPLGNGMYVLDDTNVDYAALAQSQSAAHGQAAGGMHAMDDNGGEFTPDFSFATNDLWLQMTTVTNGMAYLNLNDATDQVYEIFTKTDLTLTNWYIETEVWPTNPTVMPFTISQLGRTNLFVWGRDWTGITENGNETPDWWFWEYFGTTALFDTNLDSLGANTLLYDYQNGFDPNIINFSLSVTNQFVNIMSVPVQLNVTAGVPSYMAVVKDDSNYVADATWQAYAGTNITVPLGFDDGWHDVWIGLKGLSANAQQTWQYERLKLISTPPSLVITNPTVSTVSVPMIQLQGYSPEALSGITYDITNAAGLVTNQQVLISDKYYDTNTWEFTTNTFQAVDVPLTNGLNIITLYATDLAGNTTVTNFSFTLDYSSRTNPPVVNLYWPQNGTLVCNSNYTWRGWVDDPTATVAAQMVDTNGDTNFFNGIVERNGNFWVENIPISSSTNFLTLTVTDSAGNVAVTNIMVFPGAVGLTIDAPDSSQLWNQSITVTGTISDSSDYTVWVNGVKAVASGTAWTVTNVYLPPGGTAVIQARAIPDSDNGGNGTGGSGGGPVTYVNMGNPDPASDNDAESQTDRPMRLFVQSYQENQDITVNGNYYDYYEDGDFIQSGTLETESKNNVNWTDGSGGSGSISWSDDETAETPSSNYVTDVQWTSQQTWPASLWPTLANGTQIASGDYDWPDYDTNIGPAGVTEEHCDINLPYNNSWQGYNYPYPDNYIYENGGYSGNYAVNADTVMELQTGGKGQSSLQNLWQLSGSATQYSPTNTGVGGPDVIFLSQAIATQNITIMGQSPGSDGNVYVVLPDNTEEDVTPKVAGVNYYTFTNTAQEYTLTHLTECTAAGNTNNNRTTIGIGEVVDFSGMPNNTTWSISGAGTISSTNGGGTTFTASMSQGSATVTATIGSATIPTTLSIVAPNLITVVSNLDWPPGTENTNGTQMGAETIYTDAIGQTSVSFYNAYFRENPGAPISVTWPNGTNTIINFIGATNPWGVTCGSDTLQDEIAIPLVPISYIFNGTNYVDFSFSFTWTDQYRNETWTWADFYTLNVTVAYRASDKKCRVTYLGVPGGWQGPY